MVRFSVNVERSQRQEPKENTENTKIELFYREAYLLSRSEYHTTATIKDDEKKIDNYQTHPLSEIIQQWSPSNVKWGGQENSGGPKSNDLHNVYDY